MNYTIMELDSKVIAAAELFSELRKIHTKGNSVSIGLDLHEIISLITNKSTDLDILIETSQKRTIGMANNALISNNEIMDASIRSTIYEISHYAATLYKKSQGLFSFKARSKFSEIRNSKVNIITIGNGVFFECNGQKFLSYATKTLDASSSPQ